MSNNNDLDYDVLSVKPNLLNLINLHTLIYNKNRENSMSMIEGVNPRVPNDTSEIQEEFNSIMVEHLRLEEEDPDNTIINKYDEDENTEPITTNGGVIYILKIGQKSICYSKSRMSLLICGSNMMSEDNGYGTGFDIVKL